MVYRNIYNRIEIIRDSKGKIIPLWSKIKYKHRNMLHLFRDISFDCWLSVHMLFGTNAITSVCIFFYAYR